MVTRLTKLSNSVQRKVGSPSTRYSPQMAPWVTVIMENIKKLVKRVYKR